MKKLLFITLFTCLFSFGGRAFGMESFLVETYDLDREKRELEEAFKKLPHDSLFEILCFLDTKDLLELRRVCKEWNNVIRERVSKAKINRKPLAIRLKFKDIFEDILKKTKERNDYYWDLLSDNNIPSVYPIKITLLVVCKKEPIGFREFCIDSDEKANEVSREARKLGLLYPEVLGYVAGYHLVWSLFENHPKVGRIVGKCPLLCALTSFLLEAPRCFLVGEGIIVYGPFCELFKILNVSLRHSFNHEFDECNKAWDEPNKFWRENCGAE